MRAAVKPLHCIAVLVQEEIIEAVETARGAQDLAGNLAAASGLFEAFEQAAAFVRDPLREALTELRSGS